MPHFAERFRFNLANPFASDFKLATNLFQSAASTVIQAKPQA
jgi:hypothetical protein